MRKQYYTVKTQSGITFHIQAANEPEAQMRARSPVLANYLARMMQEAVSNVRSVLIGLSHTTTRCSWA